MSTGFVTQSPADRCDVPSFPTRRSSDLAGDGCSDACAIEPGYACAGAPSVCNTVCGDGVIVAPNETCDDSNPIGGRSEEHTSELQSQSKLVCRLLLEKKKRDFEGPQ